METNDWTQDSPLFGSFVNFCREARYSIAHATPTEWLLTALLIVFMFCISALA